MHLSFTFYMQLNVMDCGPTCLRMETKYYGKHFNAEGFRQRAGYSKMGISLFGLSESLENIGFRTRGVQLSSKQLTEEATLPCILY